MWVMWINIRNGLPEGQFDRSNWVCLCSVLTDEFKLLSHQCRRVQLGSAVTLSCHLSPEINAVNMEIRWFNGTDCVCLYKNRQMTEGRGYKGRVSLFTQELDKGNVSLQLRESRESDIGLYLCHVTDGERTGKFTVRLWWRKYPRTSTFFFYQSSFVTNRIYMEKRETLAVRLGN